MAVKFVSVKCPDCGADLDFEDGRTEGFCSYCGSKIMMENDNEFTYHYVDEAAVRKADTDKVVKMKMLEEGKNVTRLKLLLAIGWSIAGGLLIVLGFAFGALSGNENSPLYMMCMIGLLVMMRSVHLWRSYYRSLDESIDFGDKIIIPEIGNLEGKSYKAIAVMFESAGFTNVRCVPLHDLKLGLLKKAGNVESIVIDGKQLSSSKKRYSPDVSIIISYHSH